jgi:hypothetical protein
LKDDWGNLYSRRSERGLQVAKVKKWTLTEVKM